MFKSNSYKILIAVSSVSNSNCSSLWIESKANNLVEHKAEMLYLKKKMHTKGLLKFVLFQFVAFLLAYNVLLISTSVTQCLCKYTFILTSYIYFSQTFTENTSYWTWSDFFNVKRRIVYDYNSALYSAQIKLYSTWQLGNF